MHPYLFSPSQLASPRLPGISAFMRIKNGADFLEITIRSHLPYFDEIVACYNGCTDDTALILQRLAAEFPTKLRVFHYEPEVHPVLGDAHRRTASDSVHSMANYYNYTLAQCRYQVAVKLDDDHLPIAAAMQVALARIRCDIARRYRALYCFSGLNLCGSTTAPRVYLNESFVGTGDIVFFPISPAIYFVQGPSYEQLYVANKKSIAKHYVGLLYLHLKHLKADYGFANLPAEIKPHYVQQFSVHTRSCVFEEFNAPAQQQQLIDQYGQWNYKLRQSRLCAWVLAWQGREQPLRVQRLQRFQQDVARIQWQSDVLDWLHSPATHAASQPTTQRSVAAA